ncbi:MAG: 30S ribosome-binding factor RbfA [Lachnospiraceae bacterium]|nr:30S ribosome-binding factor RbfA [Lachnospiraceae bacterium]
MRKNSIKNTRINGEVKKELSRLISQEVKDPRISPWTTVTEVEVAPDLKTARVYISVLGSEEEVAETKAGLKSAAPYLRSALAKSVNLLNTPELRFVMDQSIEYSIRMSQMIDEVNAEIREDSDEPEEA